MLPREGMRLTVVPDVAEEKTGVIRWNLKNDPNRRSPSFDAADK